ncbi:OmpA family protein [Poseidonibacter sp.]|uniref:OmpA family protein n=1 Tax=Poseidonibacter sp. TaxID=2321188 RepID=UPI003C715A87
MNFLNLKTILSSIVVVTMISGCATKTGNQTIDDNQRAIIGTTIGAIAGIALGNNIGGGNKNRNKVIGAVAGAAIGGAIGYSLDKQAKEVANSLNTNVNNNPNAPLDPSQDLIVSNTDNYVKIMFRDAMMFETNQANPTMSASAKINKVTGVLAKYPNTLVQVVGHTDNRGTYSLNKQLSEQRASNVGTVIYNSGVKNQIFSKGCSYDKPIAPNTNATNMALNRRVEIFLYPNQQSVTDTCK